MSTDASKVAVAITGAAYRGKAGATAPTGTASALTSFDHLGYLNADGITRSMPGAGDRTAIKVWQNGESVRIISTPSEDNPTYSFVLVETKKESIEAALGVSVTQSSTEGHYVIDTTAPRTVEKWLIDIIDGDEAERHWIPKGTVTEIGDTVYAGGEPIGYEITIEAERDAAIGGQVKVWSTRLKSVSSGS